MKATAQTKRRCECNGDDGDKTGGTLRRVCICGFKASRIIESPPGQSWAEFCDQLEKPAFLYPVTGFGDLE